MGHGAMCTANGKNSKHQRSANIEAPPLQKLFYFFAGCDLSGLQKSFDEFTLTADGHAGKFLEPSAIRHFRFGVQLIGQKSKLISGNIPAGDKVKQMVEQAWRKTVVANSRHGYSP